MYSPGYAATSDHPRRTDTEPGREDRQPRVRRRTGRGRRSLPTWLILLSLKTRQLANQRQLAEAVGIRGATLTHHLDAMEADGLVTRHRNPQNRRIQHVELTDAGDAAFHRMRQAAMSFDQRLRADLSDQQVTEFTGILAQLEHNTAGNPALDEDEQRNADSATEPPCRDRP